MNLIELRKASSIIDFLIERQGFEAMEFGKEAKSVISDALNIFAFWNASAHKVSMGESLRRSVVRFSFVNNMP